MAPLTGWPSSYHYLDAAKRTGRRLGHEVQLFAGPEVLKILARVARGISGAAKGAPPLAQASSLVLSYQVLPHWGCAKSPKKSKKTL